MDLLELKKLKKPELIKHLVDEFGAEESEVKKLTIPKLIKLVQESQKEMEALTKESNQTGSFRQSVDRNKVVSIMNGTTGRMSYDSSHTGQEWVFNDFGQIDEITVGELITIKNQHPRYLKEHWMIILDDETVNYLGLESLYKTVFTNKEQVVEILEKPVDELQFIVKNAPVGMKALILDVAKERYQDGKFDSMSKIKVLQEELGVIITPDLV